MKNLFSYSVENEFTDQKETIVNVNYCGHKIGEAFMYLDDIHIHFTENEPMVKMNEWHFIETILNNIKKSNLFTPVK